MKKYIGVLVAALLVGCSNHVLPESTAEWQQQEQQRVAGESAEIKALLNRARWGDGKAYLELADCYRDGVGVRQDFLGMIGMAEMACQHGAIDHVKSYYAGIPEGHDFRPFSDLIEKSNREICEEKDSLLAQFSGMNHPESMMFQGLIYMSCGDTIIGMDCLRQARDGGSTLAELALLLGFPKQNPRLDEEKLLQVADRIPIVYQVLGKQCLSDSSEAGKRKAAQYFMQVEKHAMLSKKSAAWLLRYYKRGGDILLTEEDVRRLESFVRTDSITQE